MTAVLPTFPLDHPLREEIESAHNSDHDPHSTNLAVVIVDGARANGYPTNPEAAKQALTGPSAAVAVQGAMEPFLSEATDHDGLAQRHSETAVQDAREGWEWARRRRALSQESVRLADGSSQTRGQVYESHLGRIRVAAAREGRGDLEHLATPPGFVIRLGVAVPASVIEAVLLLWPVTNASWGDPKTVASVVALAVAFFVINHQLPKWAGRSFRDAREVRSAVAELTAVGITAGREGDLHRGRGLLGEIDEPLRRDKRRAAAGWGVATAMIVAVYATVMFSRVFGLAEGLHRGLLFSVLAAALLTVFTAAGPILLTWRWSRGNLLGDQLRETGAITTESCALQEQLAELAITAAQRSREAEDHAASEFARAAQAEHDGQRTAARGLQKAADILRQPEVLGPQPTNLYPVHRPLREHAQAILAVARITREQIGQMLAHQPFPAGEVADPWMTRSGRRTARPNPTFVPRSQLGDLHAPGHGPKRNRRETPDTGS